MSLETTFEPIARAWHEHWKSSKSPRHAEYVLCRLEADVFPEIGKRPIVNLPAPILLAVAKKIETRGAVDIAKRAWQTCG